MRCTRSFLLIRISLLFLAFCGVLVGVLVNAQLAGAAQRTLYWKDFTVTAHLDGDGLLRVTERQHIVFNGEWNGGERVFSVRPGQTFRLHGLYRETGSGGQQELEKGSLSKVDRWNWHDRRTLRWRSRLPSDPPFTDTELIYTLEYSLGRILVPLSDTLYSLNHDFAFPNRSGTIRHFSLKFTADSAWKQTGFPVTVTRSDILPGQGVVISKNLTRLQGAPRLVYKQPNRFQRPAHLSNAPAPAWLTALAFLLFFAVLIFCTRSFFRHEKKAERFKPAPNLSEIDHEWLDRHVFSLLPETVGAAWDKKTGGHEVAAVLARLVLENKLASRLEPVVIPFLKWRLPGQYTLHLELLVPRDQFNEYERKLIDGFFIDGTVTDTRKIRAHYRRKGSSFNPARQISSALEKRVEQLTRAVKNPLEYRWLIPLAGLFVAFFMLLANGFLHQNELVMTFIGGFGGLAALIVNGANGLAYRRSSDHLFWRIVPLYLVPLIMGSTLYAFYYLGASALLTCGTTILFTSVLYSGFYNAKTRDSPAGVKLGKRLSSARNYFKKELAKESPALKDEWFPYLLAFGLGPEVSKWTRQFASEASSAHYHSTGATTTSSHGGFSGGGGNFGGGGASGAWAAAASSLGSGSSSSSGGGGGGGSSGGGGGGGW